jgi:phage head maturation protease
LDTETEPQEQAETDELIRLNVANETLQTLSVSQRRIGLRLLPYNTVAVHPKYGPLLFEPGAFVGSDLGPVDPTKVRLRMDHEDPPTGLGDKFTDMPDAPYLEAVVSKTARGDDQLTLAADGVSRGASVGYNPIPGKSRTRRIDGQSVTVYPPASAVLAEVSTTWMPTFSDAGVMYVLSKDEKEGDGPVADPQEGPAAAPVITPGIDYEAMAGAVSKALSTASSESKLDKLMEKFDQAIELSRSNYSLPQGEDARKAKLTDWVSVTLRKMAGEIISPTELHELALDDVVISEQPGLVPATFTSDYDDLIDRDRPFLESTREISPPRTGTTMTLPVITVRAAPGTQAGNAEKGALTTTATKVGTGTFTYQSIFGGADISIQFINRADPSFFDLLTGDMAMAYALDADGKAITKLLAGYTDSGSVVHAPTDGGILDPEDPNFGVAWKNAIQSTYRRGPDTIWLSADAVSAFIDAKAPLTNAPLYSNLAASFTAGTGVGGVLSGLRPIYVPALDDQAVDVIVGPSRGFVWAEDPARTLQADVPSVAGRDIALVGGLFAAPRYADAFTTYTIAS